MPTKKNSSKDKSFVERQKEKKKIKAQKKIELIDEEDWWDTVLQWALTNWLTVLIIFSLFGYWVYIKADDYLEDRRIAIEAMKEVDNLKERTEQQERDIEEYRSKLEQARVENALLRKEIEKLSPKEKQAYIEDQISKLKDKMQIVEEKGLGEKLKEGVFEVTSP